MHTRPTAHRYRFVSHGTVAHLAQVKKVDDCIGPVVESAVASMQNGEVSQHESDTLCLLILQIQ